MTQHRPDEMPYTGSQPCEIQVRKAGALETKYDEVAEEVAVALVYNGISHAVMMATPLDLEDFGRGFSFTEGIVSSMNELLDIEQVNTELGIEIQLQVTSEAFSKLKQRRRQLSGRTGCGLCGLDSLQAVQPGVIKVPAAPLPSFDTIERALEHMQSQQQLQARCGAVHAAALFNTSGTLLSVREDVGRHNALDKLIGSLSKAPEVTDFILVSSRASYEMVAKAASLGVSTLVAVSAPTTLAINLARQAHMNLIGFIRPGRQVIYNSNN